MQKEANSHPRCYPKCVPIVAMASFLAASCLKVSAQRNETETKQFRNSFGTKLFRDSFETVFEVLLTRTSHRVEQGIALTSLLFCVGFISLCGQLKTGVPNLGCRHPFGVSDTNPGRGVSDSFPGSDTKNRNVVPRDVCRRF